MITEIKRFNIGRKRDLLPPASDAACRNIAATLCTEKLAIPKVKKV